MRAVIVSVRYADFLAVTLPRWKRYLPEGTLSVVTAPDDYDTRKVALANKVPLIQTLAWQEQDTTHIGGRGKRPRFNKPFALDHALGLAGRTRRRPIPHELCVAIDADVVPFGMWPDGATFDACTLYGMYRYKCHTHADLKAHEAGALPLDAFAWMHNKIPCGYFQAFRYQDGLRFGSYHTAGDYDADFSLKFAHRIMLTDGQYVLHLGRRGGRANWISRTVAPWLTAPPKPKVVATRRTVNGGLT